MSRIYQTPCAETCARLRRDCRVLGWFLIIALCALAAAVVNAIDARQHRTCPVMIESGPAHIQVAVTPWTVYPKPLARRRLYRV